MLTILILVIWYIIGVWSFIYWWRKRFDFTTNNVFVALLSVVIGPLMFILGFIEYMFMHVDVKPKILIKKKDPKTVTFVVNRAWSPEQVEERDRLIKSGYRLTKHEWGEFDNFSVYEYSK